MALPTPPRYPIWFTEHERRLLHVTVRQLLHQRLPADVKAGFEQILRQYDRADEFSHIISRIRKCLRLPAGAAPVWLSVQDLSYLMSWQHLPTALIARLDPPPRFYTEGG